MIGHSGNFDATVKAIECLDRELGRLYEEVVEKRNGTLYITADHGNAEEMFDTQTKQPKTAHTTNPVYFLKLKKGAQPTTVELESLSDIAPFILQNMKIKIPKEME